MTICSRDFIIVCMSKAVKPFTLKKNNKIYVTQTVPDLDGEPVLILNNYVYIQDTGDQRLNEILAQLVIEKHSKLVF